MVYLISLLGYKMSILVLYIRLFGVNRSFQRFSQLTMFVICGYLFANLFTQIFGCSPRSKYWNPDTPGHCINYTKAGLVYGSMNIASDLFILVLPLPVLWRLKLSRREKVLISLIFMSGAMYAYTPFIFAFIHIVSLTFRTEHVPWPLYDISTSSTRMQPMQSILYGG